MRAQVHLRARRRLRLAERGVACVAAGVVVVVVVVILRTRLQGPEHVCNPHCRHLVALARNVLRAVRRAIDHVVASDARAST
eukprot:9986098-Alexandrium_andersonii.AAC.1